MPLGDAPPSSKSEGPARNTKCQEVFHHIQVDQNEVAKALKEIDLLEKYIKLMEAPSEQLKATREKSLRRYESQIISYRFY